MRFCEILKIENSMGKDKKKASKSASIKRKSLGLVRYVEVEACCASDGRLVVRAALKCTEIIGEEISHFFFFFLLLHYLHAVALLFALLI